MKTTILLAPLLAFRAAPALADGLSDYAAAARFSTERGAEIALVHALDTIDGAVPALTP